MEMNCEQANNIDILELLERLGFKPQRKIGKEYQFTSPFRPYEKKGSFFVSHKGWFDHAEGEGSNSNVDLIKKYLELQGKPSSISEVLIFIKSLGFGGGDTKNLFVSDSTKILIEEDEESDLELIRSKPVEHPAIFEYLESRGISKGLIKKYLVEVDYKNRKLNNKVFFAFSIPNHLGGFEIRSASSKYVFKSSLIAKSFSFIKGQGGNSTLSVFEGVTDFLSLLTLYNSQSLSGDALILNSLSSAKKAIEFIGEQNYTKIHLWLDNDEAGKKMCARFQNELSGDVSDESYRYAPHKDINQALVAQNRKEYQFDLSL